jgi:hypothetical protein
MRLFIKKLRARVLLTMIFASGLVRAEDVTAVRLRYKASSECADEHGFFQQVAARTQRVRLADSSEHAIVLIVSVRDVRGGLAGRLVLRGDEGVTSAREVKAASCDQVVAALAIMAALAIDPDASTAPLPKPPVVTPRPPPPKPVVRVPARTTLRPAASLRSRWKGGVSLAVLGGVFDEPVASVRPFVELAREGHSAFGYALRLSAARFRSSTSRAEGTGEFALSSGRLEACPGHVRAFSPLWISTCLALDAGWLAARGADVTPRQSVSRGWAAGGEITRIELRLFDALALEASGEVFFPFVRDRFFVGSDATVLRTPAVVGGGTIGLGVFFL